jgi:hypothetical protein
MRALLFILIGIALTLGTIHFMGPERFMQLLYGQIVATGNESVSGSQATGGKETTVKKTPGSGGALNGGPAAGNGQQ